MSAEVGCRNTYYNGALILIDFTIKNTILLNNIGLYLHVLFWRPSFWLVPKGSIRPYWFDTGSCSMQSLWHRGQLIMDNSWKLKYEAHQKQEGHNRKSTRFSVGVGTRGFVSLLYSRLDRVFSLRALCSLSNNNW